MTPNSSVPTLFFDGQFIDVLWDNHENLVRWFEKYFTWKVIRQEDWKVDPRCLEGKMTQMNYGTWLVSYLTNSRLPHHYAERGTVESNIRLCFRINELGEIHKTLSDDGVRVSPIYDGPVTKYFDIWATPEGIRLTLQEDLSVPSAELFPSWIRVGVKNLDDSIMWYEQHMGMKLVERDKSNKFVIMTLKLNHSEEDSLWCIEQKPIETFTGKVDGQIQPVCWINSRDDFFKYHQYLIDSGIETSEIGGFVTRGMVSFHFYDPDGNRFNISSM
ncbi:VOC family protein [Cohnella endophytica]|uniref:VOC family protein n=1 Tax=Cohnella endophytica TaxID=2419778 RepID=A0A494YBF5_9BACL|nr:VOC family protein [Cohnella endophytica]RKP57966.1 VOC family protein [Cohnella endophytica]